MSHTSLTSVAFGRPIDSIRDYVAALEARGRLREIQRIVFRDGPAVMGDPSTWPNASGCIAAMTSSVTRLQEEGTIANVDPEATARLVNGAMCYASQWIANADDPHATSVKAVDAFRAMLDGLQKTGSRSTA